MMWARILRRIAAGLAILIASGTISPAAPLLVTGTFSAPLPAAMAHASLPAGLEKQVQSVLHQWSGPPGARKRGVGSYRLVAVTEADRSRLMAVAIHLDGEDYRFYRDMHDGGDRWVDGSGNILGTQPLLRPVAGGRISSPFGWRIHPVLGDRRFHNGVDFALPTGSSIYAAADGVVTEMGAHGNYGRMIRIQHADGRTESVYAHLHGFATGMKVGRHVKRGQKIATVGQSGLATGPHLYWEVSRNDAFVDPLPLLKRPKPLSPSEMRRLRDTVTRMEEKARKTLHSSRKHA